MRGAEAVPDASSVDKNEFHLFNPTPTKYLRDFATDRPDKTESPYTVDAGHLQLELDLVSYTLDREKVGGVSQRMEAWAIAPINIKVGLCNRLDAQFVFQSFNYVEERTGQTRSIHRGYGDTLIRLKYNVWGNDAGSTAFAAIPYVKFPTSQDDLGNHNVEGGLILPLAVQLPAGFGLGLMTQFDVARDEVGQGNHAEFVNTITVGHDIVGKLAGYVEFFSAVSAERESPWVGTFDFGFTYGLRNNIQLDAGLNLGVTKSAPDWNPFLGISWHF